MNNCPKCGNPLGAGISTCPICGTNTNNVVNNNSTVSAVQPVAPNITPAQNIATPTVTPNSVQTNSVTQVAQTQQPSVAPTSPAQNITPQPSVAQPVVAPVQPSVINPTSPTPVTSEAPKTVQPTINNMATPSQSNQNNSISNPAPATIPMSQATQIQSNNLQTTVQQNQPVTPAPLKTEPVPIPSLTPTATQPITPTAVSNSITPTPKVTTSPTPEKKETKKGLKIKVNKNVLIIAIAAIVIIIFMSFALNNKKSTAQTNNTNQNSTNIETPTVAQKDTITGGFKYKLEDGWIVESGGNNVIVKNAKENVVLKLEQHNYNLSAITKDNINNYLNLNSNATELSVDETQIGGKASYLVNAKFSENQTEESNKYNVQYYFINGGPEITLGATVIYLSDEAKTTYEGSVVTLLGSLSYSDGSQKALQSIEEHYEAFSLFSKIIRNSSTQTNQNTDIYTNVEQEETVNNNENNETIN